ncbi:hypothetical protein EPI10_005611 [Gossypium australe]|uniref:Uncharacterized protein n=1 Tax=Gossypium australe TaxID=47621 RepID=A0A5B6WQF8_9ROSI|nr:hypothetical protein EPI10_005611 [Gossypium australe]
MQCISNIINHTINTYNISTTTRVQRSFNRLGVKRDNDANRPRAHFSVQMDPHIRVAHLAQI